MLCLAIMHFAGAQVRYVDGSRPSSGDGTSWATAYKTLAEAMQAAAGNTNITQILVATGTYYPAGPQTSTNRDSAFTILRGNLRIFGGYPAGGGNRDLTNNPTFLSGEINNTATLTDNSFHIMVIAALASNADSVVVDGFVFCWAYANDNSHTKTYNGQTINKNMAGGLAMFACANGEKVTIRNCIFAANTVSDVGGGMVVRQSSPLIVNCVFQGNIGDYAGGLFTAAQSVATVDHCTFAGNNDRVANGGGAMRNSSSSPIITNTIMYGNADGISNFNTSIPVISYSLIQGLTATTNGNISGNTDPLFVGPVTYFNAATTDGNYRIGTGSPCIDKGSNAAIPAGIINDVLGNYRIIACATDIGAYEFPTYPNMAVINSQSVNNTTLCNGGSTSFSVTAANVTGYQWQVNTGAGFTNITNGAPYSGATTTTLTINPAVFSMNGYIYRCVASSTCNPPAISNQATLTVIPTTLYVGQQQSRQRKRRQLGHGL